MKMVTGERVVTAEGGFNPAWQRHRAEYAKTAEWLPETGTVLDLGCGTGHSFELLAPRETVGVDIDAGALEGQARRTVVADMRTLPFADDEFASVISVQSLEHVPDPERVVAEVARVVEPGGVVVFITPNRLTFGKPDEIIDPYHFKEFDADQLAALCRVSFPEVEIQGLFGSPRYMELHDEERVKLDKLLKKDPLKLRRLVPLKAKQYAYDYLLSKDRDPGDPRPLAIDQTDFFFSTENLAESIDLCAICHAAP